MRYVRVLVDGKALHGVMDEDRIALLEGDPIAGTERPSGREIPAKGARLLVPCVPGKILGVGLNYRAHAKEMGKPLPDEPLLFLKPPSALVATDEPIVRPAGYERVDYEGELCVVVGRRARHVDEAQALDYVFGYTLLNDVTVRDLQKKDVQYTRAKGFDTFAPVGPAILSGAGVRPETLRIRTRHNGVQKQDSTLADLVFSVEQLVSFASRVMTLEPGDLLTTGTPPGVANLSPGDVVEIEIEGIGVLRNPVVAPSHNP